MMGEKVRNSSRTLGQKHCSHHGNLPPGRVTVLKMLQTSQMSVGGAKWPQILNSITVPLRAECRNKLTCCRQMAPRLTGKSYAPRLLYSLVLVRFQLN